MPKKRRSPLGLRGLKYTVSSCIYGVITCRSPLGLRGLKSIRRRYPAAPRWSQPSWAAWIEIANSRRKPSAGDCRSPLGLRGLKWFKIERRQALYFVAALLGCVD